MAESPALKIARAHVQAWSNKDFDTARSLLAPDVRVVVMTTDPALPVTDLTGVDAYMQGLLAYAAPIVPGSVHELTSVGDERNALLALDLEMAGGPFGAGSAAPCARIYLIDNGKIKTEQVIFYLGQR
jgi:ketosteroid isomerase-like protein